MLNKEKLERGNQNHISHFTPHTSQKGITLIALIITIIVMLILVGVTINVVLTGGLFDKAEEAKKGTQIATEKEQLLNAMLGTLDNNGKYNLNELELPNGFRKVSEDTSKVIYEGPSTNQYEVDKESGKIEEVSENITPTPPNGESEILGLYGNKEEIALEFLEDGKVIWYMHNESLNGEYNATTMTFTGVDENGETQVGNLNYTYETIKDENTSNIINKIVYIDYGEGPRMLTTQGIAGLNVDLYDNKRFKPQDDYYQQVFYDGYYKNGEGSIDEHYYCVHYGYIWEYYEDESLFWPNFIINDDGTITEVSDSGRTYYEVTDTE